MRFILKLSYNGTAYHGWQKQENANSVQSMIENALKKVTGLEVDIMGCGRTDTGVHAACYFAHFKLDDEPDSELVYKLNSVLPNDIAIEQCKKADANFHARFDAVSREYRYFIHFQKNPFLINQSYFVSKKLDVEFNRILRNFLCCVNLVRVRF